MNMQQAEALAINRVMRRANFEQQETFGERLALAATFLFYLLGSVVAVMIMLLEVSHAQGLPETNEEIGLYRDSTYPHYVAHYITPEAQEVSPAPTDGTYNPAPPVFDPSFPGISIPDEDKVPQTPEIYSPVDGLLVPRLYGDENYALEQAWWLEVRQSCDDLGLYHYELSKRARYRCGCL